MTGASLMRRLEATGKMLLAFFLVIVSAGMVILWMLHAPETEPNSLALLAGFVTLFIKMAADAVSYWYGSSAGSQAKDVHSAEINNVLAGKLIARPAVTAWWSLLSPSERAAIQQASTHDPKVFGFIVASATGKATHEDLEYLVSRGLLSKQRAELITLA